MMATSLQTRGMAETAQLPNKCSGSWDAAETRPKLAEFGDFYRFWPMLSNTLPISADVGRFWPIFDRFWLPWSIIGIFSFLGHHR